MKPGHVERLVGRKVEIVTTWREKVEGNITTRVRPDGTFLMRCRRGDGYETRVFVLDDIASMRPARRSVY